MILKDVLLTPLPKLEIMDMEAMIGGEDRYAVIVEQGGGNVTGFEPNPKNLEN